MHVFKAICCAAAVTAITVLVAPNARADEWNKKTYLTFSAPVQIPGATLPAGTYLFQLADPDNARHVVEVASKDGTHVYGMFLTIPNQRMETPDNSVVMFSETPAGAPQAIEAWWYPGERYGEEFVYPKDQAMRIAKANHRGVLATEASASGSQGDQMNTLRGSKVSRVDENGTMNANANNAAPAATNTAESVNKNANTPSNQSHAATTTAAPATTTARANTTTAPSNTVDGRDKSKSHHKAMTTTAKSNTANNGAAGTTGQVAENNTAANTHRRRGSLPQTASSLALFELLSGLSLAGAFGARRLRRRMAEAR